MTPYKVIFLIVAVTFCDQTLASDAVAEAKCECGIFKSPTSNTTTENPLASKTPKFDFDCTDEGKQNCLNMCKALAGASREDGPKKLCELLKNTSEPFVPLVYYRACGDTTWNFTGLQPTLKVCCANDEAMNCPAS